MIALLLAIAPLAAADAREADPVREMAGAYHESGSWVQVIPVDGDHAYVHLYFVGGLDGDRMTEFEQIMTLEGRALRFRKTGAEGSLGCSLTLQREDGRLAWTAPEQAPCAEYSRHQDLFLISGAISTVSRRPASRTYRYPGEAEGYRKTVADWRKAGNR